MSTEQMRKLMEASAVLDGQPVEENIITESICTEYQVDEISEQTVNIMATTNVPALYMTEGDTLCLESTDGNYLYSETNGMKYERSFISGLENRGMIEIIREDASVEEGIAGDAAKDIYRKATGRVTDKAGLERMVNIYVEQAISHLELGMQMRNENDAEILVKTITSVRKDLIELQQWIRERK